MLNKPHEDPSTAVFGQRHTNSRRRQVESVNDPASPAGEGHIRRFVQEYPATNSRLRGCKSLIPAPPSDLIPPRETTWQLQLRAPCGNHAGRSVQRCRATGPLRGCSPKSSMEEKENPNPLPLRYQIR